MLEAFKEVVPFAQVVTAAVAVIALVLRLPVWLGDRKQKSTEAMARALRKYAHDQVHSRSVRGSLTECSFTITKKQLAGALLLVERGEAELAGMMLRIPVNGLPLAMQKAHRDGGLF